MVTVQLANMTGDSYFLFVFIFLFYNTIIRTNKTVQLHKIQTTNDIHVVVRLLFFVARQQN